MARENGQPLIVKLPDELEEVRYLFDPKDVKIIEKGEATEEKFRSVLEQFSSQIIHISAHGEINDEYPLLSRLLLDLQKENTLDLDGDISLGELYNLKINTQIAILSACQTGSGESIDGSGKINLARGFAYADCPSIIMSLWDLNTKSNLEIINKLYQELIEKNQDIDVSLQHAQIKYIEAKQKKWKDDSSFSSNKEKKEILKSLHPYYWAGLVLIGRTDALGVNRTIKKR